MEKICTDKFSDISILVRSLFDLDPNTITTYNVLVYMLKSKTEHFDSKQKLALALNHAYGMRISYSLTGYGKQVALDVRFQCIRSDYISSDSYIDEIINVMEDILFRPLLDENSFEEAKYMLKSRLERLEEDPDSLALSRALKLADGDHDISIPIHGDLASLSALRYQDVLDLYQIYKNTGKIIFYCGHSEPRIFNLLEKIPQAKKIENKMECIHRKSTSYLVLKKECAQTSLVLIYATSISFQSPLYYPLLALNSILGQGPVSLLFEEVREKHSLCYSISSSLIRFDGALMISVGTRKDALDQVLLLIHEQIERIVHMDYPDSLLEIAKKDLKDLFLRQKDRPNSMLEQHFLDMLLRREESEEQRNKAIDSISKFLIAQAARQLFLLSSVVVEEGEDV